jgi:hypothetical protein
VRQSKLPGRTGPGDSTFLSLACPYMELPKEKVSDTINKVIFKKSEQSVDFIELRCSRYLLHGDLPGHPRVDRTEVRISSCGGEGVGEALPGFQYRRLLEMVVSTRHDVRHAIVVGPGHGCADWYPECFGCKTEAIDDNFRLGGFDRHQISDFGLLAANTAQKRESNKHDKGQRARIQVSQKWRQHGHTSGDAPLIVTRRS